LVASAKSDGGDFLSSARMGNGPHYRPRWLILSLALIRDLAQNAVAVVFGLMQPVRTSRRFIGEARELWLDPLRGLRRHGRGFS
jgi:hypothetical protein